ncbi:MAG: cobalamin-binding protein [Vibrio sp.]
MFSRHSSSVLSLFSIVFLLFSSTSFAEQPSTPKVAQRVVSLSPGTTELAYSAGLGDKLVGASEYSDYPPEAKDIERVANYQGIKLERILALQPDLVLALGVKGTSREIQQLEAFGIPVYYSNINKLDNIPKAITELSQWAEDPSIGAKNADEFTHTLEQLRRSHQSQKPIRYFYQVSQKPLMSVTAPNWPTDIFTVCGGENIIANQAIAYPQVGIEQIVALAPEVMFSSHDESMQTIWKKWPQIPAIKNDHVWSLNPDWISRPTMRSLKSVQQVCDYFDKYRNKQTN